MSAGHLPLPRDGWWQCSCWRYQCETLDQHAEHVRRVAVGAP